MRVLPLGGSVGVGRSCFLVQVHDQTIMFDCGLDGFNAPEKLPMFEIMCSDNRFNDVVDCVIITHVHGDHIGALPYFTEVLGYSGPIFMTYASKAMFSIMINTDYTDQSMLELYGGRQGLEEMAERCIAKVTAMDLNQTIEVGNGIEITAYQAGHVLGAGMFHVKVQQETVLYTGDFNACPDRELERACIPRLSPDLMICETTHGLQVHNRKRGVERKLLAEILNVLERGGRVLYPMTANGRLHEMYLMLEEFFDQLDIGFPIYISHGLQTHMTNVRKLLPKWTRPTVRGGDRFSRLRPWPYSHQDTPSWHNLEPCIVFATKGNMMGGLSLALFKEFAQRAQDALVIPQVQGSDKKTFVAQLAEGNKNSVRLPDGTRIPKVECKVIFQGCYSGHTDAKGILEIVAAVRPKCLMPIHGEPKSIAFMCRKVKETFGIHTICPPNGTAVHLSVPRPVQIAATPNVLKKLSKKRGREMGASVDPESGWRPKPGGVAVHAVGAVQMAAEEKLLMLMSEADALNASVPFLNVKCSHPPLPIQSKKDAKAILWSCLTALRSVLGEKRKVERTGNCITVGSFRAQVKERLDQGAKSRWLVCEWDTRDSRLAGDCVPVLAKVLDDLHKS